VQSTAQSDVRKIAAIHHKNNRKKHHKKHNIFTDAFFAVKINGFFRLISRFYTKTPSNISRL